MSKGRLGKTQNDPRSEDEIVDPHKPCDNAGDEIHDATTRRVPLTLDVRRDNGTPPGQSTTVEDLSSARRLMDLSSMISLKAVSSVGSWNDEGGVGDGDRTNML